MINTCTQMQKISRSFESYNYHVLTSRRKSRTCPFHVTSSIRAFAKNATKVAAPKVETREEGYKRTLVVVEIYHRLPRDVERTSARALSARSREGCASEA